MNDYERALRRAWDAREATFPKFTRMRFDDATKLAQEAFRQSFQRSVHDPRNGQLPL